MASWSLTPFFLTITINNANIFDTAFPLFHALAILTLALTTQFAFAFLSTFLFSA